MVEFLKNLINLKYKWLQDMSTMDACKTDSEIKSLEYLKRKMNRERVEKTINK